MRVRPGLVGRGLGLRAHERAALHVLLRAVPVQAEELQVGHDGRVDRPRGDVDGGRRALDALARVRRRQLQRLPAPVQPRLAEARRQPPDEVVLLARAPARRLRVLRGLLLLEEERRQPLRERARRRRPGVVDVRRRVGRLEGLHRARLRLDRIRFPLHTDSGEGGVVGALRLGGVVRGDLGVLLGGVVLADFEYAVGVALELVEQAVVVGDGVEFADGSVAVAGQAGGGGGAGDGRGGGGVGVARGWTRAGRHGGRGVGGPRARGEVGHELVLAAAVGALGVGRVRAARAALGRARLHLHVLAERGRREAARGRQARGLGRARGPVGGRVAVLGGLVLEAGHGEVAAGGGLGGLAGGALVAVPAQLDGLGAGADVERGLQRQRLAVQVDGGRRVAAPRPPVERVHVHVARRAR